MPQDLLHSEELKSLVRDAYRGIDDDTSAVASLLYSSEELSCVPESAATRALGVNNHLRYADIEPGETILDIGSGAGIDTVIAAHRTGPTGKVIALDILPEMLEKTRQAVADAGLKNVATFEGEMEAIPLPDNCVDHVVSNGVINLSPRKARVLRECARVLVPGGKFTVSDLTVDENVLPPEVMTHPAAWAG